MIDDETIEKTAVLGTDGKRHCAVAFNYDGKVGTIPCLCGEEFSSEKTDLYGPLKSAVQLVRAHFDVVGVPWVRATTLEPQESQDAR